MKEKKHQSYSVGAALAAFYFDIRFMSLVFHFDDYNFFDCGERSFTFQQ